MEGCSKGFFHLIIKNIVAFSELDLIRKLFSFIRLRNGYYLVVVIFATDRLTITVYMTDVLYLDTHPWIFMLNEDLFWCNLGVTESGGNDFELGKQREKGYFKRNGDNQSLKCLYCSSIQCASFFLQVSFCSISNAVLQLAGHFPMLQERWCLIK